MLTASRLPRRFVLWILVFAVTDFSNFLPRCVSQDAEEFSSTSEEDRARLLDIALEAVEQIEDLSMRSDALQCIAWEISTPGNVESVLDLVNSIELGPHRNQALAACTARFLSFGDVASACRLLKIVDLDFATEHLIVETCRVAGELGNPQVKLAMDTVERLDDQNLSFALADEAKFCLVASLAKSGRDDTWHARIVGTIRSREIHDAAQLCVRRRNLIGRQSSAQLKMKTQWGNRALAVWKLEELIRERRLDAAISQLEEIDYAAHEIAELTNLVFASDFIISSETSFVCQRIGAKLFESYRTGAGPWNHTVKYENQYLKTKHAKETWNQVVNGTIDSCTTEYLIDALIKLGFTETGFELVSQFKLNKAKGIWLQAVIMRMLKHGDWKTSLQIYDDYAYIEQANYNYMIGLVPNIIDAAAEAGEFDSAIEIANRLESKMITAYVHSKLASRMKAAGKNDDAEKLTKQSRDFFESQLEHLNEYDRLNWLLDRSLHLSTFQEPHISTAVLEPLIHKELAKQNPGHSKAVLLEFRAKFANAHSNNRAMFDRLTVKHFGEDSILPESDGIDALPFGRESASARLLEQIRFKEVGESTAAIGTQRRQRFESIMRRAIDQLDELGEDVDDHSHVMLVKEIAAAFVAWGDIDRALELCQRLREPFAYVDALCHCAKHCHTQWESKYDPVIQPHRYTGSSLGGGAF